MGTSYLGRACAGSPAALNVDDVDFFAFVRDLIAASRLAEEARFVQHGSTSTLLHSLAVAYKAGEIVCSRGRSHLLPEAWRAALLHDYYLYDWHDSAQAGRLHGFTHPGIALKNAYEDFPDLTWREADAIARHMFPLTPVPPCSAVGWAVVAADKVCACYETSVRGGEAYPELRALCARHLAGVELVLPGPVDAGEASAPQAVLGPVRASGLPRWLAHRRKGVSS